MSPAKKLSVLLVLIFCFSALLNSGFFSSESSVFAQDPNSPDTVYFKPAAFYYPRVNGPGSAFMHIIFSNDNEIGGISAPFTWDGPIIFDSVTYRDSRVEYISEKPTSAMVDSQKVIAGAFPFEEPPIQPGNGIFATICFTLTDSTDTAFADTTFYPPFNHLRFITPEPVGYTPLFRMGVFPIYPYWPGDVKNNGGELPGLGDLLWLINYIFRNGPPPPVMVAADVDGSCAVGVPDIIYLINHIYKHGPPPLAGCPWNM